MRRALAATFVSVFALTVVGASPVVARCPLSDFMALCVDNGNNSGDVLSFAEANSFNVSDEHKSRQTYFVRLFTEDGLEFHYREVDFSDVKLVDCSTSLGPVGEYQIAPKGWGDPPLACPDLVKTLVAALPDNSEVDSQSDRAVRVIFENPKQRAHVVAAQSVEGAISNFSIQKIIFKEGN